MFVGREGWRRREGGGVCVGINGRMGTTSEVLPQHKRVRIGET